MAWTVEDSYNRLTDKIPFGKAVARGNAAALQMAKSMLTNPVLISSSPAFSIPLEVTKHNQTSQAEVSELPVIVPGSGVKSYLYDNVAPKPWTWNISGYIPGSTQELTNRYCPVVRQHCDFIRRAYKNGTILIFKDMDCKVYTQVVIRQLSLDTQAECRNKAPFSMVLQEIIELKQTLADLDEVKAAATVKDSVQDKDVVSGETLPKAEIESTFHYLIF